MCVCVRIQNSFCLVIWEESFFFFAEPCRSVLPRYKLPFLAEIAQKACFTKLCARDDSRQIKAARTQTYLNLCCQRPFVYLHFFLPYIVVHTTMRDPNSSPEERIEYTIDEKIGSEKHEQETYKDENVKVDERSIPEMLVEEYQFTWRATIVGSLLGCLVCRLTKDVATMLSASHHLNQ